MAEIKKIRNYLSFFLALVSLKNVHLGKNLPDPHWIFFIQKKNRVPAMLDASLSPGLGRGGQGFEPQSLSVAKLPKPANPCFFGLSPPARLVSVWAGSGPQIDSCADPQE